MSITTIDKGLEGLFMYTRDKCNTEENILVVTQGNPMESHIPEKNSVGVDAQVIFE